MPIREASSLGDQSTETNLSSSTTTITLNTVGLPSIPSQPISGLSSNVLARSRVYLYNRTEDAQTLRARRHAHLACIQYAEKPLRVLGQKVIVFRKYKNTNRGTEGIEICVQFPSRDNARGAVGGTGTARNYERLVIRMFPSFLFQPAGLSERTYYRSRVKIHVFILSNEYCFKRILSIHERVLVTVRGQTLRIGCAVR